MGSITLSKDVPKILKYYDEGKLKLAELIASRDKLENINESLSSAGTLSGARNVINFEQYFIIEEGTKGSDVKSLPLS